MATEVSLGVGGMFLEGARVDAEVGDELDVEWQLPDDEVAVRARAVIVWTRGSSRRHPGGVGRRFESAHPEFAPIVGARSRRRRQSSPE